MTIDKQPFEESTSPEDLNSGTAEQAQAVEKEPSRISKFMQRKFGCREPLRAFHAFLYPLDGVDPGCLCRRHAGELHPVR